jgi:transcriptional regulator with XRE-family HTH domain
MSIGPLIHDLRLARGMSLAGLAAEVCRLSGRDTVTRHDVSRWESGRRSPLENALRSYPDQWARDKSLYLTSLADAYLDAGETERSAQVASSAIRLAERVASVRPATRIRAVAGRLVAVGGPGASAVEREAAALRPPIPARL